MLAAESQNCFVLQVQVGSACAQGPNGSACKEEKRESVVVLGRGREGGGVDGGEDEVERVKAVNSKKTAGSRLLVILVKVHSFSRALILFLKELALKFRQVFLGSGSAFSTVRRLCF